MKKLLTAAALVLALALCLTAALAAGGMDVHAVHGRPRCVRRRGAGSRRGDGRGRHHRQARLTQTRGDIGEAVRGSDGFPPACVKALALGKAAQRAWIYKAQNGFGKSIAQKRF